MNQDTTTPQALHYDKSQPDVTSALGISEERQAEMEKQYEEAISKCQERQRVGEKIDTKDLYEAVAPIPQNMAEAFSVGQSVGRLAEALATRQSNSVTVVISSFPSTEGKGSDSEEPVNDANGH